VLENFSQGGWHLFACYSLGKLSLINDLLNQVQLREFDVTIG
jgi:hypothetical protein